MKSSGDLSVRERYVGGPVTRTVQEVPRYWTRYFPRLLILIHGFNVALCAACESYLKFTTHISLGVPQTGRFFWPGDGTYRLFSQRVRTKRSPIESGFSALSYPAQINSARNSAYRLAEFLSMLSARPGLKPDISIIAHSLGCRLTLEALTVLANQDPARRPRISLVMLMAAAVPRYMIRPGEELEVGARIPRKLYFLFSDQDKTLRLFFRPGQLFERARNPRYWLSWSEHRAIGLKGTGYQDPNRLRLRNILLENADHGDYWPNRKVAGLASNELDQESERVSKRRTVKRRKVGVYRSTVSWQPPVRSLPGHQSLCQPCRY